MIKAAFAKTLIFLSAACVQASAGDWTAPVDVVHDEERCVSYRAKLQGDFLIIQATHHGPWYTYAMDNKKRAEEKLAGKPSLGIDMPTEVRLSDEDSQHRALKLFKRKLQKSGLFGELRRRRVLG